MFSYTKKILSCLLVIVMLLGSIGVNFSVFAEDVNVSVNLELNGGTLNGVTSDYAQGSYLPESGEIVREDLEFAGWYDNAEFTGSPVSVVPDNLVEDVTYYARWIKLDANFDNFESYNTMDDVILKWTDWSWPEEDIDFALNKESLHTLSGKNSLKFTVKKVNATINLMNDKVNYSKTGDGVGFWIESASDATVKIKFKYDNTLPEIVSKEVTVSAGKQIVTIPWNDIPNALDQNYLWRTQFIINVENYNTEVYIDEIGTYSDIVDYNVTLNTNDGVWADGYNAPYKGYANMPLPNMDNIKREDFTFAGWYDNAELTGSPVASVPADISDSKEYWAKWINLDADVENFEAYSNTDALMDNWTNWTDGANATVELNTDANHALGGNNSFKISYIKANKNASFFKQFDFNKSGDGFAFWIESTNGATVQIKLNNGTFVSQSITVPAGKQIVTIKWDEILGTSDTTLLWRTHFIVSAPNANDVVYIDDIGTYSNIADYNVTLNTNGAKWAEGYTVPQKAYANMPLPTDKNLKNEGAVFAGWYDNAELTGSPVASVPADISGSKEYWAKWVKLDADIENFEAYSTTDDVLNKWGNWTDAANATIALNTDANHALGGNNSFKISYIKANKNASVYKDLNFSKLGDGFAFWIESTSGATVQIKLNGSLASQSMTVPAGKQIFTIPWLGISGASDVASFWRTNIIVSVPNASDVVYIDDIGTYSNYNACNVTFNTNGGSWVDGYTVPQRCEANTSLPTMDNIKRDGLVFAGWYDNADFTGSPVTTVADVSSDKEYWAKWIKLDADVENFEAYSTTEALMDNWTNWTDAANATIELNTDANHVLGGNNSFIISYIKANKNASVYKDLDFNKSGDGFAFWIESTSGATVQIKLNNGTFVLHTITVPAGKQTVTIKWNDILGTSDTTLLWRTHFIVSVPKANDIVYIDDIGTYRNIADYNVTLNTNGIKWAEGYTAPVKAYANMVLPTKANFENNGLEFMGWYDNAEFTGSPVASVPADISGSKEYWAKWIAIDANFEVFDSYSTTEDMMTEGKWSYWTSSGENATVTLNTDANHTLSGNNSLKFTVNKANESVTLQKQKDNYNYSKTGDGVAFWIESTSDVTVKIRFNGTVVSNEVTVSAGKQFVTIPWDDIPGALDIAWLWKTNIIVSVPNADDVVYIDDIGTYGDLARNKTMPNGENGFTYSYDENANVVWNYKGISGSDAIVGFATDYVLERYKNYVVAFDYKYLTNGNLENSLEPQAVGGELGDDTIKNETDESKQTLNGKDANSDWSTKKVVYNASDVTKENKYFGFYGKIKADTEYDISIKNIGLYSLGDVDFSGDINANDLASLKKGLLGVNDGSVEFADVNNDGSSDIIDLLRLKKLLAK